MCESEASVPASSAAPAKATTMPTNASDPACMQSGATSVAQMLNLMRSYQAMSVVGLMVRQTCDCDMLLHAVAKCSVEHIKVPMLACFRQAQLSHSAAVACYCRDSVSSMARDHHFEAFYTKSWWTPWLVANPDLLLGTGPGSPHKVFFSYRKMRSVGMLPIKRSNQKVLSRSPEVCRTH